MRSLQIPNGGLAMSVFTPLCFDSAPSRCFAYALTPATTMLGSMWMGKFMEFAMKQFR